jgi:AraC-like DNA-binding protein
MTEDLRAVINELFEDFTYRRLDAAMAELEKRSEYKAAREILASLPLDVESVVTELLCYETEAAYKLGFKDAKEVNRVWKKI